MTKKLLKIVGAFAICWLIFVAGEAIRLIGSTEPGKYPLIYIGGAQIADACAKYDSLGFTQYYQLTADDTFVYGEFCVLGIPIAHWE